MKLTYLILYISTVLFCDCGRQTQSKSPKLNFREFNTTNLAYNSNILDSLVVLAKEIDLQKMDTLNLIERFPANTVYQGITKHKLITDYRYIDYKKTYALNNQIFNIDDSVSLVLVNIFNNPTNTLDKWKYKKWILYNKKLKAIAFPNYHPLHNGGFKKKELWLKNKKQIEDYIESIKDRYNYIK